MKKFIAGYFLFIGALSLIWFMLIPFLQQCINPPLLYRSDTGISYCAKVDGKTFTVYDGASWNSTFLKGVNIGATKPGYFPGEFGITEEDYLRWFQYIADMNANVIRVYTLQMPCFYSALETFNRGRDNPIYLIHGAWVNEELIGKYNDAYANDAQIEQQFLTEATQIVDAIHGNADIPLQSGYAGGKYTADVSQYVIGWILGIEWSADFVLGTNQNHPDKTAYNGAYLYTTNASPFEVFLAEVADRVISYETESYRMQHPLAINNWVTTDPLTHANEPNPSVEDAVSVDMEHLRATASFEPGLFASYHIYPYYPDFFSFPEDSSVTDTYAQYLSELNAHHTMPVLVAEVGIPASRGIAHVNELSGYNQGHIDETKQGEILSDLVSEIHNENMMGAIIFAWQDEWFKKTWNTADLTLADRRAYWSDAQTNEQSFGLLAFDPGENSSVCTIDGDISEWTSDDLLAASDTCSLSVKSDEKYLYLMIQSDSYDFNSDTLYIPIDTIADQGNTSYGDLTFERGADFLLILNGKENSKILVDSYYDVFYYMYAVQNNQIERNPAGETVNSGIFDPIYLALSRKLVLPITGETVDFRKFDTGALAYGNADPNADDYSSLADFCAGNGTVEIRIPWLLLSVSDPSSKQILDDFYTKNAITTTTADRFWFGITSDNTNLHTNMASYSWEGWDTPTYHERLKPAYYVIQRTFANLQ
ncbi:MAG: family 2 glycosyl transferase [Anaerofustis sp.]